MAQNRQNGKGWRIKPWKNPPAGCQAAAAEVKTKLVFLEL
jgi:hypothetical protein